MAEMTREQKIDDCVRTAFLRMWGECSAGPEMVATVEYMEQSGFCHETDGILEVWRERYA